MNYMNYIFNKYKYVLFLITVIIISSIVFRCNYNIIENFTCNTFTNTSRSLHRNQHIGFPPIHFYSCGDTSFINFFTANDLSNHEQPITLSISGAMESHYRVNDQDEIIYYGNHSCINKAIMNGDDIFIIKDKNDISTCMTTGICGENISAYNPIFYSCSDSPSDITSEYRTYNYIGSGGFTSNGKSNLGDGYISYLSKKCDDINRLRVAIYYYRVCIGSTSENRLETYFSEIHQNTIELLRCINTYIDTGYIVDNCMQYWNNILLLLRLVIDYRTNPPESTSCEYYRSDILTIIDEINQGLNIGDFYNSDNRRDIGFGKDDISPPTYLDKYYNQVYRLTDASFNDVSNNLKEFKNVLAQENETSLETNSTFITYLFFIILLIITSVMIILNFIKPDIVTAEILIVYLIFLVMIIFTTSNYFNVNYGPLNRFLRIDLGNAGSRNIFQTPGYSTNL